MSSDYDEIARVPTFIPVEVEPSAERRRSRPNSARRSTSGDTLPQQSVSSASLNDDIEEYIKILIDRVVLQMTEQTSPTRRETEEKPFRSPTVPNIETETEERVFQSPKDVVSDEKCEEFYTPRSDEDDKADKSPRGAQDQFEIDEDTGSLEFVLKDIPIQEAPESPVRYSLSAQFLAEIDETLNSILNLEESSDGVKLEEGDYSVDEGDSSILIDYNDENPLDQMIAEYVYLKSCHVVENSTPKETETEGSIDRSEYPMTAGIEDSFNVLLGMTVRDGYDMPTEDTETLGASSLSADTSDDILLRAGLSDLEDISGISLRKSIKTPDVTQLEEPPMDTNPLSGCLSSDDEDENRGFVIMNDSEIKESLLHYEQFKERLQNEKKSAKLEDVQPVIVEMDNKEPEEARSAFQPVPLRRFGPVRPIRKQSRARSFFRRAASSLGLLKTRTWSPPSADDSYRVKAKGDNKIEVITTSFGGEPGNTLPRPTAKQGKLTSVSEVAESMDQDISKTASKAPNRRFFKRLSGTQSLPRNTGRLLSFCNNE